MVEFGTIFAKQTRNILSSKTAQNNINNQPQRFMNILFLHGMGGSGGSYIPRCLDKKLSKMHFITKDGEPCDLKVIRKTYNYDPDIATEQISKLVETNHPVLVIGESMGAIHALGIRGIPHIYLSPALNYDRGVDLFLPLAELGSKFGLIYRKRRGARRQEIVGDPKLLAKFKPMLDGYKQAILDNPRDPSYAYFGKNDPFKVRGIVCIEEYKRLYGDSGDNYEEFDGGHVLDVSRNDSNTY